MGNHWGARWRFWQVLMLTFHEIALNADWHGHIGPRRYRITYRDGAPVVVECLYQRRQDKEPVARRIWGEKNPRSGHIERVLLATARSVSVG